MKRIVITGATSMIGTALVRECINNGDQVFAVVRPDSGNLDRLPDADSVFVVACDINDLLSLKDKIHDKCDTFYHIAWSHTGKERNIACHQIKNIQNTLDGVKAAKDLGCRTFIGAGSQAEYGRAHADKLGPDSAVRPETPYGICKYAAGKLAEDLCGQLDLKCIWARIFSVYGMYDHPDTMIMTALSKFLKGEKAQFTKGEQNWDYLYCEDAGRALYLLGDKGKNRAVYCIGSGKTKRISEYIRIIREKTGTELVPGIGELPYGEKPVMNLCADIGTLANDTGFTPEYDFERGIEETIRWYRKYADLN